MTPAVCASASMMSTGSDRKSCGADVIRGAIGSSLHGWLRSYSANVNAGEVGGICWTSPSGGVKHKDGFRWRKGITASWSCGVKTVTPGWVVERNRYPALGICHSGSGVFCLTRRSYSTTIVTRRPARSCGHLLPGKRQADALVRLAASGIGGLKDKIMQLTKARLMYVLPRPNALGRRSRCCCRSRSIRKISLHNDPWYEPTVGLKGRVDWDSWEYITSQQCLDALEVPDARRETARSFAGSPGLCGSMDGSPFASR